MQHLSPAGSLLTFPAPPPPSLSPLSQVLKADTDTTVAAFRTRICRHWQFMPEQILYAWLHGPTCGAIRSPLQASKHIEPQGDAGSHAYWGAALLEMDSVQSRYMCSSLLCSRFNSGCTQGKNPRSRPWCCKDPPSQVFFYARGRKGRIITELRANDRAHSSVMIRPLRPLLSKITAISCVTNVHRHTSCSIPNSCSTCKSHAPASAWRPCHQHCKASLGTRASSSTMQQLLNT